MKPARSTSIRRLRLLDLATLLAGLWLVLASAAPAAGPPRVRVVGGGAVVAALAGGGAGEKLLVGLYGGGLLLVDRGGEGAVRRITLADGLPSQVVRALAVDPVSGVAYAGTENGLVSLPPDGGRPQPVAGPLLAGGDRRRRAATLVVVSPAGATVLFQLEAAEGGTALDARFMTLKDGRLHELTLTGAGGRILGLSAGRFDAASGCFLLAGVLAVPGTGEAPAVVRRCGETTEIERIDRLPLAGGEAEVDAVEAVVDAVEDLARHPATGELVLALRYASADGRPASGLFVRRDGRWTAAAEGADDLGAAVTVLLGDPARRRLLVGTAGAGLKALPPSSAVETLVPSSEILSLTLAGGAWVAGTRDGLLRAGDDGPEPFRRDLLASGPLAADLLPYELSPRGELLVGSPRRGFAVLGRDAGGRWQPRRLLSAGRELPADLLWGEAVFETDGASVVAVGLGRGLLWPGSDPPRWLTPADGLRSGQILRLWRHPASGHLWVVYAPLPSRDSQGGLHWFDGAREVRFVPLAERAYATIQDLLYVPERGTVFTAGVAGVLEFDREGGFERRSNHRAAALARDPASGAVLAVGATVELWDGVRFSPLFFRPEHRRLPPSEFALRPALDVAADRRGRWHVLYPEGYLVTLGPQGKLLRFLDTEDGIPRSAQRILYLSPSDELAVGSAKEGMIVLPADGS